MTGNIGRAIAVAMCGMSVGSIVIDECSTLRPAAQYPAFTFRDTPSRTYRRPRRPKRNKQTNKKKSNRPNWR